MVRIFQFFLLLLVTAAPGIALAGEPPLGLPPAPIPAGNPQTPEKISLGDKLFHDTRFSSTGTVSCATCHDAQKAFTDSPLKVSEGIHKLTGTRNAPTVVNSAYFTSAFWDGRSPDLEDQSLHPFINPVEMGLKDHQPILKIVRTDPQYINAFKEVFGKSGEQVTMKEVTQAIAAFERTIVAGDSPFDRWYFGGDDKAMSPEAKRGFEVFVGQGRCVSCHTIEQTRHCSPTTVSTTSASASTAFQRRCRDSPANSSRRRRRGRTWTWRCSPTEDIRARPLRGHRQARRPGRVQDADPAQHRGDRPLHARRQLKTLRRRSCTTTTAASPRRATGSTTS
jgi:cytochrome c peroxidase